MPAKIRKPSARGVAPAEARVRHGRFLELRIALDLPDVQAAHLLGVHHSTWSIYCHGGQPVPKYILASVQAHAMLLQQSPKVFARLLKASEAKRQQARG